MVKKYHTWSSITPLSGPANIKPTSIGAMLSEKMTEVNKANDYHKTVKITYAYSARFTVIPTVTP